MRSLLGPTRISALARRHLALGMMARNSREALNLLLIPVNIGYWQMQFSRLMNRFRN